MKKGFLEVTSHDVGQNVRAERIKKKLRQADLAELMQVAQPRLTQIENGWHGLELATINNLAKALNVPVAKLVQTREPTEVV